MRELCEGTWATSSTCTSMVAPLSSTTPISVDRAECKEAGRAPIRSSKVL